MRIKLGINRTNLIVRDNDLIANERFVNKLQSFIHVRSKASDTVFSVSA